MTLFLLFTLMTAAAIFAVLWPLAQRGSARDGSDLAVYRDQLDEVGRDHAQGRIGDAEAEAARIEISRRLLASADARAGVGDSATAGAARMTRRRRAVALLALIGLPAASGATYLALGAPQLPGQPLMARAAPSNPDAPIERLIAQVEARLAQDPQDGRGWDVIAPVYLRLGRYDDAVAAWRKAIAINGEEAGRVGNLGEAIVGAANGVVTADAKAQFDRALVLDATAVKPRYFLGVAAQQDGRFADAAALWRALLAEAPPDTPWAEYVRTSLDQVEAIPAMVERLAARMKDDRSDLDGWLRLVRSYMVLGQRDKARAAAHDARAALASEPDKVQQVDRLTKEFGLDG